MHLGSYISADNRCVGRSTTARATVTDVQGKRNLRNWKSSSAEHLRVNSRLPKPRGSLKKCSDKRLSIEPAALMQWWWQMPDGMAAEELGPECHGHIH